MRCESLIRRLFIHALNLPPVQSKQSTRAKLFTIEVSLRFPTPHLGSGLNTLPPWGGVALAGGILLIVDHTVDQNTPVAATIMKRYPLFCGVNADHWCLQAEPTSLWGHHISQMIMTQVRIRQPTNVFSGCWLNAFEK